MKHLTRAAALLLASFFLISLFSCAEKPRKDPDRLSVVATIFPYYDTVKAILGDRAEVRMLIRPGTDAHSFDPTPSDMRAADECDVFIYTGGESDEWAESLLASLDPDGKAVVKTIDAVPALQEVLTDEMTNRTEHEGEEEAEEEVEYDEHVWTSPKNMILITDAIADALMQAAPELSSDVREGADAYKRELQTLDEAYRRAVDASAHKTLIFGDRFPFRYLAEEYGICYAAAFPGCSSETEPSVKTMIALSDRIREENADVIYTAEYSSKTIAEVLAQEVGAQILELHSCHTMRQTDIDSGATYLTVMYRNLENLKRGLGQ